MRSTVALAVLVAAAACAGPRVSPRASPLVGKEVEVAAPDLAGHPVRVNDDAGKVRVVDFFATWCEPCREQLPFLGRLAAGRGAAGLSVYAVSFDEDRAALERFQRELAIAFPVLWDKGGEALASRLEVTRLPTTLLVDRHGVVRYVHLGFDRAEEARIEREVSELLSE